MSRCYALEELLDQSLLVVELHHSFAALGLNVEITLELLVLAEFPLVAEQNIL